MKEWWNLQPKDPNYAGNKQDRGNKFLFLEKKKGRITDLCELWLRRRHAADAQAELEVLLVPFAVVTAQPKVVESVVCACVGGAVQCVVKRSFARDLAGLVGRVPHAQPVLAALVGHAFENILVFNGGRRRSGRRSGGCLVERIFVGR